MPRANPLESRARLVKNQTLGAEISCLTLEAPWIAGSARPGQFIMVGCAPSQAGAPEPLLMRPLAVAGVEGGLVSLLMAVKGRGTRFLAAQEPGAELTLRGPLGNGFSEPKGPGLLLVAGGLGAAPLLSVHRRFRKRKDLKIDFILGVPGKGFESLVDLLAQEIPDLQVFSDDGCMGAQGNACTALPAAPDEVWACGPVPMYRALLDRLDPGVPVLVSLEARMGCGYGGCLGCVVPTKQGNLRACCEGPVFDGREILWHEFH